MSSQTPDDLDAMVESALWNQRKEIAANVEGLGCECINKWPAPHIHAKTCPRGIAAAIRARKL